MASRAGRCWRSSRCGFVVEFDDSLGSRHAASGQRRGVAGHEDFAVRTHPALAVIAPREVAIRGADGLHAPLDGFAVCEMRGPDEADVAVRIRRHGHGVKLHAHAVLRVRLHDDTRFSPRFEIAGLNQADSSVAPTRTRCHAMLTGPGIEKTKVRLLGVPVGAPPVVIESVLPPQPIAAHEI